MDFMFFDSPRLYLILLCGIDIRSSFDGSSFLLSLSLAPLYVHKVTSMDYRYLLALSPCARRLSDIFMQLNYSSNNITIITVLIMP